MSRNRSLEAIQRVKKILLMPVHSQALILRHPIKSDNLFTNEKSTGRHCPWSWLCHCALINSSLNRVSTFLINWTLVIPPNCATNQTTHPYGTSWSVVCRSLEQSFTSSSPTYCFATPPTSACQPLLSGGKECSVMVRVEVLYKKLTMYDWALQGQCFNNTHSDKYT